MLMAPAGPVAYCNAPQAAALTPLLSDLFPRLYHNATPENTDGLPQMHWPNNDPKCQDDEQTDEQVEVLAECPRVHLQNHGPDPWVAANRRASESEEWF